MKIKELMLLIEQIKPLKENINYYRSLAYSVYGEEARTEYEEKVKKLEKELNDILATEI